MSACRRVVHLDLKSCNVLIAGDGTAKISDVGLALLIRDRYLSSTAPAGTFSWVAPEVILGGGATSLVTPLLGQPVRISACTYSDRVTTAQPCGTSTLLKEPIQCTAVFLSEPLWYGPCDLV